MQVGLFNILQEGRRPDQRLSGPAAARRRARVQRQPRRLHRARQDHHARSRTGSDRRSAPTIRARGTKRWRSRRRRRGRTGRSRQVRRVRQVRRYGAPTIEIPAFVREIVEEIAFQARGDQKVDRRSGVSQRLPITTLENVVSNAERRALRARRTQWPCRGWRTSTPRCPSVTGKIELEYEGELKGAEPVARELVRAAVATVFDGHAAHADVRPVIDWFENGGTLDLSDTSSADGTARRRRGDRRVRATSRRRSAARRARATPPRAAVADFILEGLCALEEDQPHRPGPAVRVAQPGAAARSRPKPAVDRAADGRGRADRSRGRRSTTTNP